MQMIFLFFLSAFLHAAPEPFKYELSHRTTSLVLNWDGKSLKVKDRRTGFEIPYRDCSMKSVDEFLKADQDYWKDRPASKPDPIVVVRGSERIEVSSGSQLGGHLLAMKDKMILLKALTDKECR